MLYAVGTRVKLVSSPYENIPKGAEGVIVGYFDDDPNTDVPFPYYVKFNNVPVLVAHREIEPC